MSKLDIVRAWKDEEYCESLSDAEKSRVPTNPAGLIELTEHDMGHVGGGTISYTLGCDSFITICSLDTLCLTVTITVTAEIEEI